MLCDGEKRYENELRHGRKLRCYITQKSCYEYLEAKQQLKAMNNQLGTRKQLKLHLSLIFKQLVLSSTEHGAKTANFCLCNVKK